MNKREENARFFSKEIDLQSSPLILINCPTQNGVCKKAHGHNPLYSFALSSPFKELTIVYEVTQIFFKVNVGHVDFKALSTFTCLK